MKTVMVETTLWDDIMEILPTGLSGELDVWIQREEEP